MEGVRSDPQWREGKSGLFALTSGAQPHGRAYDRGQHGPFAVFGPTASEHFRNSEGEVWGLLWENRVCALGLAHCLSRTRPSPYLFFILASGKI